MLETVLFDLDGTITDPKEGITKSIAYALKKFHIQVDDFDTLTPFIGPPLLDSFMEFFHFSETDATQAIEYYREYFAIKGMYENVPYEHIEKLLQSLDDQQITCIIATSKPEIFSKQILEHFHLLQYFKDVCGASMDASRNKKADIIAYAMEKHALSSASTIMVGDRKHDVLGAKENKLACIGVLYGYGSIEELTLAGADAIAPCVSDLEACIQGFN